ncbi:MAG: alpha-amylase [Lachnospiraceae bacterium]|nr:alpha-amylase [Lachnospiraceae bacterium]
MSRNIKKQCMGMMLGAILALSGCGSGAIQEPTEVVSEETTEAEQESVQVMELELPDNRVDDNNRMYYEVFVYSFADSDGDGIGDLKGLTERLDYIEDLGCNGIWLMPVNASTTYHKYDVTDYYAIDPEYGTLEDFQAFLKECEERHIKVIMDLVVNHSSSKHPWFTEAAEYLRALSPEQEPDLTECPYVDYYHFVKGEADLSGYVKLEGSDYYYEAQFWDGMPDLNLGSEALRTELEKVMSYWLDMGVGGFRLDAVKEYYTGHPDESVEVISWIVDYCKSVKEDAYIVGEAWDSQNAIEHYYESGIDSLFNFPFAQSDGIIAKSIRSAGDGKAGRALAEDIVDYHTMIRDINEQASDAPFLSNHDVGRASGFLGPDLEKVKFGNAVNILMGGNAFLYYGEELGMVGSVKGAPGKDENKRAPMYWNDNGDDGMTAGPPDMDEVVHRFESYEQQKEDNESIYHYIRNIIRIRNAYPQIGRGIETVAQEIEDGDIVALWKEYDGESVLLLMNNSDQEKAVSIPERDGRKLELGAGLGISGEELTVEDGTLTLTPFGVAVLK